ncbi:MAG: TonB-dependent receptor, partial [Vicinamibacteraceae bacterium]
VDRSVVATLLLSAGDGRRRMRWNILLIIIFTLDAATPCSLLAQVPEEPREKTETAPPPEQLLRLRDDVEVTAAWGAVDSDRSPASSTVVTRQDLERRGVRAVDQALSSLEGVAAYRTQGIQDREVGIGMRGFSGRGTGQSRVLILFDGQPMNNSYTGAVDWSTIPLDEVERVEVVRGGFSALYGGNAMGGLVNILTRPADRRSIEASAQYGSQGSGQASARFSDRFFQRLGLTIAYSVLQTDGYRAQTVLRSAAESAPTDGIPAIGMVRYPTSTGGITYGVGKRGNNEYEQYAVRSRSEYTVGPRTFSAFQYIRQSSRYAWGPYETWVRSEDGLALDTGDVVFEEEGAWKQLSLSPSNFLGARGGRSANLFHGQLLHSASSHGLVRLQAGVFDTPLDWYALPGATATSAGGPGTQTRQQNRGAYASLQWSATGHARHALTMGTDTRYDSATVTGFSSSNYLSDELLEERDGFTTGSAFSQGLYAQDLVRISDDIQLTLGARYDYWRTYDGENEDGTVATAFPDRASSAVTAKVAALYRLRGGTILRGSAGTAFRQPSVYELYRDVREASGLVLLGNSDVDPEHLTGWDAGVRQTLADWGSFDASYYENRVRDLIYRSTDLDFDPSGQTRRLLNAGRSRARGVELGATLRPARWLTARPTYTFTDSIITRNDLAPASVDKRLPFVPRHTASATITGLVGRWSVSGTARYQSDVFATDTNTDVVSGVPGTYEAFFEADLAVSFEASRHVSLRVTCENVFDERYFLYYRNPGRVPQAGVRIRY